MATSYRPETLLEITPEALYRELSRVSESLNDLINGEHVIQYAEPEKPRRGVVVYADGSMWNPGSGEGLYAFDGTLWVFLGVASAVNTVAAEVLVGAASSAFTSERLVTDTDTVAWDLTTSGQAKAEADETLDWL